MSEWQPIETAPLDDKPVLLHCRVHGAMQGVFCPGEWSDDTPNSPAEYDGPIWLCGDDLLQVEIEECSPDPREWHHGTITHWQPLPEPPK